MVKSIQPVLLLLNASLLGFLVYQVVLFKQMMNSAFEQMKTIQVQYQRLERSFQALEDTTKLGAIVSQRFKQVQEALEKEQPTNTAPSAPTPQFQQVPGILSEDSK